MVNFYIDSVDINEIKDAVATGFIKGVTTNPIISSKSEGSYFDQIKKILEIPEINHISVEPLFENKDNIYKSIISFANLDKKRIVIKLPPTLGGLSFVNWCRDNKIKTNVTLVMSWFQAYIAMKAEADYISLLYGRIGDLGYDPVAVIRDTMTVKMFSYPALKDYVKERENPDMFGKKSEDKAKTILDIINFPKPINSQIIIGSIRGGYDLIQILPTCPDIITVPYKILKNITNNPKSLEAMIEMNEKYKEKNNGK